MAKTKTKDIDELKALFNSGDYVRFPLKSVLLEYPHLAEPDTKFDAVGVFKVNAIIADDVARDMEAVGLNVKENSDGQKYIICKRKAFLGPPKVTKDGDAFDPRTIGNGTVATIDVAVKSTTVAGKTHLPVYIDEVKIEDLVAYEGAGSSVTVDPF